MNPDALRSNQGMNDAPNADSRADVASLFGTRIDALSWELALVRILRWADARESRMVCLCNVHSLVSAGADAGLRSALQASDMNAPDGAPVAWMMRRLGWPEQQRLPGPDLMAKLLLEAARLRLPVFLLGATAPTLALLAERLRTTLPGLPLAGTLSPPFRPLDDDDNALIAASIAGSGARLVLVGLGCPKQEKWMAAQRGRIPAVMVGVGAAFDYHAGTLSRAPASWQRNGFEWLYRLLHEPARLAGRYMLTNTLFLLALPFEWWRRPRA
jgi:N-acetylglucosaminyldiphosphoundecaprenol N-acetyl-beta-D-mannosaminyltransferase